MCLVPKFTLMFTFTGASQNAARREAVYTR